MCSLLILSWANYLALESPSKEIQYRRLVKCSKI